MSTGLWHDGGRLAVVSLSVHPDIRTLYDHSVDFRYKPRAFDASVYTYLAANKATRIVSVE